MVRAGNPRARIVLAPDEGETVWLGGLGVRSMIDGKQTGETFALVEHPMEPRVLAAPMHTHQHEDEYTYVLEGEIGVQVGDEVRVARPVDLVFKPRHVPHAFWNAVMRRRGRSKSSPPQASSGTSRRSQPYSLPPKKALPTNMRSALSWRNMGSRWI